MDRRSPGWLTNLTASAVRPQRWGFRVYRRFNAGLTCSASSRRIHERRDRFITVPTRNEDLTVCTREQLLIERAQAGDRRAFEELVFMHDRLVLSFALHMLGNRDDARDAYQETFMKAFRAIGRFRGQSSF